MKIIHVDESSFEKILKSGVPVLADFYADWCTPCKMVAPILEEVAKESNVQIVKVNVDEQQGLAAQYKVMSIPTLILFENGVEKNKRIGVTSKADLLSMIQGA